MTRLRGFAALLALGVVGVGVPWALARFGNWPITGIPTLDQLAEVGDTVVSDTAVFSVLTVAAWTVWVVFMFSVVVEIEATIRRVPAPQVALAGPLQRSARLLVTAVVLAITVQHTPRTGAAATPLPSPAPESPAASAGPEPGRTERSVPAPATAPAEAVVETIVVARGDSAWSLAEAHLGDGMRWRELWNANHGRRQPDGRSWTDPQLIRPGWHLHLPTQAPRATSLDSGVVHQVVAGDSLSSVAEAHLGDPDRYREIYDLNRDVTQPDGRRLNDPNLILPGWNLRLPTAPTGEAESAPSTTPPVDVPATAPSTHRPAPIPTTTTSPTTRTTIPTTEPTAPTSTPAAASPPATPASSDRGSDGMVHPGLAGVTGAVVLATGVAIRIGMLRRRRATRGVHGHRRLSARSGPVLDAVVAAGDIPLVRWAGQQLARLTAQLDPDTVTGSPVAVEISDTAGIEVLWNTPQPDAPDPWTSADGGWAWRLHYDPDAAVPADEFPAAIPALVTIGRREGRQLLLDLEAYGAVTVSGPADTVGDFLRSLAVELATSQDLSDADVHVVGLDVDLTINDRLATTHTIVDAVAHLDRTRRMVAETVDTSHPAGTFAARLGSTTPLDASVAIAGPTADDVASLIAASPPRHGVAVVAATDPDRDTSRAPAHIEVRSDGTAHLEPLGITFALAVLPATTTSDLDGLLTELDETGDPRHDDPEHPNSEHDVTVYDDAKEVVAGVGDMSLPFPEPASEEYGSGNGRRPSGRESTDDTLVATKVAAIDPALLVRVLGSPAVPDRPELRRRELIITTLLACRAGPVAASAVQDAVWGGKPVEPKTVWNVIGATRRALGPLPDGTPVLPPADRTRGTLRVDPGVVTDLAILRQQIDAAHHLASSEAIAVLRDALGLVNGPPFDAPGYDWAHRDQDVAEASTLIEHATEMLVDLALETNAADVARDAVVLGLRGLPGNEQLYRCRMRVEHHAGNLAGVRTAYDELVVYLADLETEPSPSTTSVYHELIRPARH